MEGEEVRLLKGIAGGLFISVLWHRDSGIRGLATSWILCKHAPPHLVRVVSPFLGQSWFRQDLKDLPNIQILEYWLPSRFPTSILFPSFVTIGWTEGCTGLGVKPYPRGLTTQCAVLKPTPVTLPCLPTSNSLVMPMIWNTQIGAAHQQGMRWVKSQVRAQLGHCWDSGRR